MSDMNVAAVSAEKVRRGGLLDVHQEVPFEDKFALLVLLAFLVGLVLQSWENGDHVSTN